MRTIIGARSTITGRAVELKMSDLGEIGYSYVTHWEINGKVVYSKIPTVPKPDAEQRLANDIEILAAEGVDLEPAHSIVEDDGTVTELNISTWQTKRQPRPGVLAALGRVLMSLGR